MCESVNEDPVKHNMPWWLPTVLAGMAGGLAWGIRGQYGHETGAMIAGLLVSLTVVFLLSPKLSNLSAARAVAWCTVAMGIGGTMTYGQTVGLTHDAPLVGNWAALRWGMLGLGIKGGLWIGFAGLFLGMGLGGIRYRPKEMLCLLLAMLGVAFIGIRILNEPYDPANKDLPWIYFSDDWHWEPEGGFLPRRETWGGLLFAYALVLAYTGWVRKDRLARNLGLWGLLAGGLGFPGGQSVQAFFVWNRELFNDGFLRFITTGMNPWNIMEISFGTIMGAIVGLGSWFNRAHMKPAEASNEDRIPLALEWGLLAIHIPLLVMVEFAQIPWVDFLYDFGPVFACIPLFAITSGRWWPYLQIFTVTLIPIAGKTLRALAYQGDHVGKPAGWLIYVILPLAVGTAFAVWMATRKDESKGVRWWPCIQIFTIALMPIVGKVSQALALPDNHAGDLAGWVVNLIAPIALGIVFAVWMARCENETRCGLTFLRRALLYNTWLYFFLNHAFFGHPVPWPWMAGGGRSHSGLIFVVCVVCLTLGASLLRKNKR